jgi:AmiR/NasT family two-component response regulator
VDIVVLKVAMACQPHSPRRAKWLLQVVAAGYEVVELPRSLVAIESQGGRFSAALVEVAQGERASAEAHASLAGIDCPLVLLVPADGPQNSGWAMLEACVALLTPECDEAGMTASLPVWERLFRQGKAGAAALQRLQRHGRISAAVGLLAERHGIALDPAFKLLRGQARSSRMRIDEVALMLLPAAPRQTQAQPQA